MKRISTLMLMVVFGFCFVSAVNAAEPDLGDIATISSTIGGSEVEISPLNEADATAYKYYYKIVEIDDSDFSTYVKSKYVVDNGDDSSDEYVIAQSRVSEYESTFNALIPTVSTTADLSSWTESTDGQINLSDLKYGTGEHHGYVLGVTAVKSSDNSIYVSRIILESSSTSTLDNINYNNDDVSQYTENTQSVVTTEDEKTTTNPETGLDDYAIYLVPIALIGGSAILLRRNYA